MNEWQVKVEKILISMSKDMEFIKSRLEPCEKEKIKSMIKTDRWLMGVFFTATIALIGVIITRI